MNQVKLTGHLLIATPALDTTPFERTVVLVIQQNQQGTFGAVLNRPADEGMQIAWQSISGRRIGSDRNILAGGPVGGPVFAIHQDPNIAEFQIDEGLYFAAKSQSLKSLVNGQDKYKVFFGAAGWTTGQLEREISEGNWIHFPVTSNVIFKSDNLTWTSAFREFGRQTIATVVGIKNFPADPTLN